MYRYAAYHIENLTELFKNYTDNSGIVNFPEIDSIRIFPQDFEDFLNFRSAYETRISQLEKTVSELEEQLALEKEKNDPEFKKKRDAERYWERVEREAKEKADEEEWQFEMNHM